MSRPLFSPPGYWVGQALGWSLFLAVNLLFILPYQPDHALDTALVYGWAALTGVAVSHFWHLWIQRHGCVTNLARLAVGSMALGVLQTASTSLAYAVFWPPGTDFRDIRWLPGALIFWICVMAIWTGLYGLGHAIRRARRAEFDRLQSDVAAKEAALQALKSQTNPHFFFNSLNSVRALVFIDAEAAARMIDQLAALMRYSLDSLRSDTVPLAEELAIIRTYLAVERTRFGERLRIEESIGPGFDSRPIPPMIVQPLVENAVKYGTATSAGATILRLRVQAEGSRLLIEIANSGHLAPASHSTGLGLANLRQRLALLYGGQAELRLEERPGWVVASLLLPETVA
jgi:two-component sensor histidine kinase